MQENALQINRSNDGALYPRICNISKEKQVIDSFTWIFEKFGGVDVLVNAAGIIRYTHQGHDQHKLTYVQKI